MPAKRRALAEARRDSMDKINKDRGITQKRSVFRANRGWGMLLAKPVVIFLFPDTMPQGPRLRQKAIIKEVPVYICIKQTKALKQKTEGRGRGSRFEGDIRYYPPSRVYGFEYFGRKES